MFVVVFEAKVVPNGNILFCSIFSAGPNIKSKESKRKEDFSIKLRSPVGANPVTSSRFTVSPASDPHLVWWCASLWEPSENNQPSTRGYFFTEYAPEIMRLPFKKAGHITGFTSDRILYDGVTALLPAFN